MSEEEPTEDPRQVGTRATVKVAILMEYHVDVELPPSADAGEQADFELFASESYDDYDEKDVIHAEVVESAPAWSDEYDSPEEWPSRV